MEATIYERYEYCYFCDNYIEDFGYDYEEDKCMECGDA